MIYQKYLRIDLRINAVGTSNSEGSKGTFGRRGRFLALAWHNFLALVLARSWRKILNSVSIPRHFSNHSTDALYQSFSHFVPIVCRLFSNDKQYWQLFWPYSP